jgi:regulator of RNase E activity RraA
MVEGPARDIDESIERAFPIFARSLTARTARDRIFRAGKRTYP